MTLFHTAWHGLISKFHPVNPFGAVFMVTHRCNARCAMCNLWCDADADTPIESFVNLVEQPLFKDIANVAITGGELTLRTDLEPLFQALLEHCPKLDSVNLSSNAFLPERLLDIVINLAKLRNSMGSNLKIIVQISMDGPETIHDTIRGVPGGFQKVQKAIRLINEQFSGDDFVEIHHLCVLQPANIDHIDEILEHFDNIDIPVTYNMVCDASYLEVDPETHPVLNTEMKDTLIQFYTTMINRSDIDPRHRYHYQEFIQWLTDGYRRKPCGMLTQHILVDHHGQILPCMNAGNYTYPALNSERTVNDLWSGTERRDVNKRLKEEACPRCMAACGPNTFDAILALVRQKLVG